MVFWPVCSRGKKSHERFGICGKWNVEIIDMGKCFDILKERISTGVDDIWHLMIL